jgi:hypothetical protein
MIEYCGDIAPLGRVSSYETRCMKEFPAALDEVLNPFENFKKT